MKKFKVQVLFFSVAALLFACVIKTEAQKAEVGLRFMPTFSSLSMKTSSGGTINGSLTLDYGYGLFFGYNFTEHVGAQAEVIYTPITQKYSELDVEREIKLQYINIPLLLSLNTGKTKAVNFNGVVGPQLGLSVGSELHVSGGGAESEATAARLSVKTSDVGFAYGVGVDFGLNSTNTFRLGLGFRGVIGLFDISDNSQQLDNSSFYVLEKSHIETYSGYVGCSLLF